MNRFLDIYLIEWSRMVSNVTAPLLLLNSLIVRKIHSRAGSFITISSVLFRFATRDFFRMMIHMPFLLVRRDSYSSLFLSLSLSLSLLLGFIWRMDIRKKIALTCYDSERT